MHLASETSHQSLPEPSPVLGLHACAAMLGFPVSIIPSGIHKEPQHGPSVHGWHWLGKLTNVQDAVSRPAPPPALQLLVLSVLQPAVMKNYTDDTLWKADVGGDYVQGLRGPKKSGPPCP